MGLVCLSQSEYPNLTVWPSFFFVLIEFLRLGIEGLVIFKHDMQFDAENYMITVNGTMIAVFDKVTVRIEIEKDKNTQRGKVKMTLVNPIDSRNL